jgi:hypothetical protein
MAPFNLLEHPALVSQRRRFHRRWTFLTGLLVGSLVALGCLSQVQEQRLQQERERGLLQFRLKQVQNRLAAHKDRQAEQKTWSVQDAHVQALGAQLRRWEALHRALIEVAGPESVQLLRLQLDAQLLELHGQATDTLRMAQARERLSKPWAAPANDTPWTLVSLASAPSANEVVTAAALEFVWQTKWVQEGSGPTAMAPRLNAVSAELGRVRP